MFITFEGIDASGKTTQLGLLQELLVQKGFKVLATKQPGGTEIGQLIRQILLNPDHTQISPETEVLLYLADRVQHLHEIVIPAIKKGLIVLCDRYHDATLAYQGGGRQLDLGWQKDFQTTYIVNPDLTFWLDIPVLESRKRLDKRNADLNVDNCRLEREDVAFFDRIRNAYEHLCLQEPERFVRIPALQTVESIQNQIAKIVIERLD